MQLSLLERRILLTVAYCHQFSYPLTLPAVWQRLPVRHLHTKITPSILGTALEHLVSLGLLETAVGFYYLAGSQALVKIRQERAQLSQAKWSEAQSVVASLQKIPWITGIAVTGSLAVDNVVPDDDIDFLIITQEGRLWLTRLLVTFHAWWHGKRRSWQREEANSWCFNLWLEESSLATPSMSRTLYTAYEICQCRFLYSKNLTASRFLSSNNWIRQWLPEYYKVKRQAVSQAFSNRVSGGVGNEESPFWEVLNLVAYRFQLWYMQSHRTRERVGLSYAFFHPRDTKALIYEQWQTSVQKVIRHRRTDADT